MKNKFAKGLLTLTLLVGGTAGVANVQRASADDSDEERFRPKPFLEDVTHSVELIDNGVIITITTDNEDTLLLIQEKAKEAPKGPMMEEVDREIELISNGVQITLTSEDPEVVEKLQNAPKPGSQHEGRPGPHGPMMNPEVNRSVENIDNGVVITLTTDDAEVLEKLQTVPAEMPDRFPGDEDDITRSIEKIENGIVLTITSEDPETVEKIQEHEGRPFGMKGPHGHGFGEEQTEE